MRLTPRHTLTADWADATSGLSVESRHRNNYSLHSRSSVNLIGIPRDFRWDFSIVSREIKLRSLQDLETQPNLIKSS